MIKTHIQQHTKRSFFALLLASVMLFGVVGMIPQSANAHNYEPPNTGFNAQSAAANTITAGVQESVFIKEWTLDGIAWGLAKIALQEVTGSIVQWIGSGFQGSPSFVTNIEGFLLDIADQAAGDFIYGSELGFLCSPFELDVRLALELHYLNSRDFQVQCTLSDVIGNIDNFISGSFTEAGWEGWFEMAVTPSNNLYGAYAMAEHELGIRIRSAQGGELSLLNFGEGFLSWEDCEVDPMYGEEVCSVVTPGQVIEEQLQSSLGFGQESLIVADEIDEIIGALFVELAQQAITGARGLLGVSGGSWNGGGSYVSQLGVEENYDGFVDDSRNAIQTSITDEEYMRSLNQDIASAVNSAENYADSRSCSNRSLTSELQNRRSTSQQEITSLNALIATLQDINARYEATLDSEERDAIFNEYLALRSAGLIHNRIDAVSLEFRLNDVQQSVSQFRDQVDNDCRDTGGDRGGDRGGDIGG